MQKTRVLGVGFHVMTMQETVDAALSYLADDGIRENGAAAVYTPNPEVVMCARRDAAFMDVLERGELVIPDGIGVVYAMRINGVRVKDRVPGCDLVQKLFAAMNETGQSVYFLGGAAASVAGAAEKMAAAYPGLQVAGYHDGYFKDNEDTLIIEEIERLKPDLLLVGLGCPRQEKWIDAHRHLPVKLMMGVGGSIDVMSGTVKRAPKGFQKLGLEWLYRLAKQPSRLGRQMILPMFMLTVIGARMFGGKDKKGKERK